MGRCNEEPAILAEVLARVNWNPSTSRAFYDIWTLAGEACAVPVQC